MVHHLGALSSGHYVASVKSQPTGKWHYFNDNQVRRRDERRQRRQAGSVYVARGPWEGVGSAPRSVAVGLGREVWRRVWWPSVIRESQSRRRFAMAPLTQVTEMEEKDLVSPSAYILFYMRRDCTGLRIEDVYQSGPPKTPEEVEAMMWQRDSAKCSLM